MGNSSEIIELIIYFLLIAVPIVLVIALIALGVKKSKKRAAARQAEAEADDIDDMLDDVAEEAPAAKEPVKASAPTFGSGPRIVVNYVRDGGLLEDGKCGWLDVECEHGTSNTYKLNFNKKKPEPVVIPLKKAVYRISYRDHSKAAMLASGVLMAVNESNGFSGALANEIFDLGVGMQFDSVDVEVDEDFVLTLACTTDGVTKKCVVA